MSDDFFADSFTDYDAPEDEDEAGTDDADDADASDDAEDEEWDDSEDSPDEDDDPDDDDWSDDEDGSDDDDEDAEAERLRAELAAMRAEQARQQQAAAEAQADAHWAQGYTNGMRWFDAKAFEIKKAAENAYQPIEYIWEQLRAHEAKRQRWINQFHANRERALWEMNARIGLPDHARAIAKKHRLPEADLPKLMEFAADDMDKVAAVIADARRTKKRLDAERAARDSFGPGSGRGSGSRGPVRGKGLDRYIASIFEP